MNERTKLALVGPSTRFLSGISYYTIHLSNALSERADVQTILFRHMLPKKFFPGWKRVGENLAMTNFRSEVYFSEMLDWYNPFSWMKAANRMRNVDVIIFQWWTSSVAHMYLAIQLLFLRKVPVIIEYHEVVDSFELSVMPIRLYSKIVGRIIRRFSQHYVVHSEADRELVEKRYQISQEMISNIPLGLFDQYPIFEKAAARRKLGFDEQNIILFFGLLRPYKGVKYLIQAFNALPDTIRSSSRLLIVGEAWEDHESILLGETSPYRENITIINRYVGDEEIPFYFSAADMLVLPYIRASQSAVAQIGMTYGLPIIASNIAPFIENLSKYQGTVFIEPEDIEAFGKAIIGVLMDKRTYSPPDSLQWNNIAQKWLDVFKKTTVKRKSKW
jgi:glycosyltransferase involved in cell wall biosynthesis